MLMYIGIKDLVASSILTFPIAQPAKSADPTGGVQSPMPRFNIRTTPN